jgi:putative endonuclease
VRSRFGEIDIIAQDKAFIVFVEVKARSKDYLVSGKEAMTKNKIEKIKKTALFYAGKNLERFYRFDVLEIIQGKFWRQYDLLKGAFDYTIEDYRQPL